MGKDFLRWRIREEANLWRRPIEVSQQLNQTGPSLKAAGV